MNTSIDRCHWTATARDIGRADLPLREAVEVDVAIIGGGIVGTIAARLLKDRGQRIALVEAGRAGYGVTGRSTAKVTAQHSLYLQRIESKHGADAARTYATANIAGVELVAKLADRHSLACDLEPADSWVYALTDEGIGKLEKEHAAAERAGLPMTLGGDAGLPFPVRAALRLVDQRQFQPVDFVAQLAATLPGDGSFVFEHSPVNEWSESWVRTAHGSVRARRVIMATHLPLGQVGQFYANTSPHMHAIVALPVAPDRAPSGMYITVDEPKRSIRTHRRVTGETMLVLTGPTFKHGDVAAEQDAFAQLEGFARKHFGYEDGGYRWTNEDYTPRDGLPYIGWSGSENESLLVATGFDAWGLSNGAAAGQILADLCDGRENERSDPFDASRHSLTGVGKLVSNAASVAYDLVAGHAHKPPPSTDTDHATVGEIVEIDGRAAGLYRDSDGTMRAISAVCTHMGCMLGWNPVDRSWDCACHGSRFSQEGRVTHGPATEPLGPIEWPVKEEQADAG